MAEKKAKTAEKNSSEAQHQHLCPDCGAQSKVTLFAGFGRKGLFLVCEKGCGYIDRLR